MEEAVMAKVIEFYKRRDWKPKRELVAAGRQARVIMFPDMEKREICVARVDIQRICPFTWLTICDGSFWAERPV